MFRNILSLAGFFLFILFFFVNQIKPLVGDAEYNENKAKAVMPIFDVNRLDFYPKQFEEYLSDNFSLKGRFLKVMGHINIRFWNKSPKPNRVIIGKDKWLYLVPEELNHYLGNPGFSENQLEIILDEFKYRKHILDSMGIRMALVLNPNKYSVYPEYLPDFLEMNTSKNESERIKEYFNAHSDINVIYPRNYLIKNKTKHQLYYKSDNHWNFIGGYYAAKEIVDNLGFEQKLPEFPFTEFCVDTTFNYKGNLANMAVDADYFSENIYGLKRCEHDAQPFEPISYTPIEGFPWDYQTGFKTGNENLPNALIIRDSFGSALMPYMRNCFNQTTYIFDSWRYGFNREIIEQEKPDIVIYMMLENLMGHVITVGLTKDRS